MRKITKRIIRARFGTCLIIAVVVSSFLLGPTHLTENDTEQAVENLQVLMPSTVEPVDPCGLAVVECPGENDAVKREVTAYTSEVSQTDGSPCVSANGANICEAWQEGTNVCAANFVPFGTRLTIEGLGTCTVMDRMNSRFSQVVDWYFGYDTLAAIKFGRQTREVIIED